MYSDSYYRSYYPNKSSSIYIISCSSGSFTFYFFIQISFSPNGSKLCFTFFPSFLPYFSLTYIFQINVIQSYRVKGTSKDYLYSLPSVYAFMAFCSFTSSPSLLAISSILSCLSISAILIKGSFWNIFSISRSLRPIVLS